MASDLMRRWGRGQWAEFWEEQDREFFEWVAGRELAAASHRRVLEVMTARAGGPGLDFSVESLGRLGHWYLGLAKEDYNGERWLGFVEFKEPPPRDYVVVSQKYPTRELSKTLAAIRFALVWYCEEVERRLVPEARLVCWRGHHTDDHHNGQRGLDVGKPNRPCYPGASVGMVLGDGYKYFFNPEAVPGHRRPRPEAMADWVVRDLLARREAVERNGSLVWQVAPTGPRAFEGRTPMKRIPVRLFDAYMNGEVGVPKVYRGPEPPEDLDPQVGMG
ncbi:MAG: hypothetical protein LBG60_08295 [Bifidobacteriaceae bacterium]|jgi:hypothetical protein|nr:hypothetical protein [Bifidobacteriaceae bacterium]